MSSFDELRRLERVAVYSRKYLGGIVHLFHVHARLSVCQQAWRANAIAVETPRTCHNCIRLAEASREP